MIGKRFELWQAEYAKEGYTDQMGVKRAASIVRRKVIVTVYKTVDTMSAYTNEKIPGGLWLAHDAAGVEYRQWLDETSYAGRYSWSDNLGGHWIPAQSRGWFDPYINTDGTKAVPEVLE